MRSFWKLVFALVLTSCVSSSPTPQECTPLPLDFTQYCTWYTPHTSLNEDIYEAASTYNVEPSAVFSVLFNESSCNPDAHGSAHEVGYMQLNPTSHKTPTTPKENIQIGTEYLAYCIHNKKTLSCYNGKGAQARRYRAKIRAYHLETFGYELPEEY